MASWMGLKCALSDVCQLGGETDFRQTAKTTPIRKAPCGAAPNRAPWLSTIAKLARAFSHRELSLSYSRISSCGRMQGFPLTVAKVCRGFPGTAEISRQHRRCARSINRPDQYRPSLRTNMLWEVQNSDTSSNSELTQEHYESLFSVLRWQQQSRFQRKLSQFGATAHVQFRHQARSI